MRFFALPPVAWLLAAAAFRAPDRIGTVCAVLAGLVLLVSPFWSAVWRDGLSVSAALVLGPLATAGGALGLGALLTLQLGADLATTYGQLFAYVFAAGALAGYLVYATLVLVLVEPRPRPAAAAPPVEVTEAPDTFSPPVALERIAGGGVEIVIAGAGGDEPAPLSVVARRRWGAIRGAHALPGRLRVELDDRRVDLCEIAAGRLRLVKTGPVGEAELPFLSALALEIARAVRRRGRAGGPPRSRAG